MQLSSFNKMSSRLTSALALALTLISLSSGAAAVSCGVCAPTIFFEGLTRTLTNTRQDTDNTFQCTYVYARAVVEHTLIALQVRHASDLRPCPGLRLSGIFSECCFPSGSILIYYHHRTLMAGLPSLTRGAPARAQRFNWFRKRLVDGVDDGPVSKVGIKHIYAVSVPDTELLNLSEREITQKKSTAVFSLSISLNTGHVNFGSSKLKTPNVVGLVLGYTRRLHNLRLLLQVHICPGTCQSKPVRLTPSPSQNGVNTRLNIDNLSCPIRRQIRPA